MALTNRSNSGRTLRGVPLTDAQKAAIETLWAQGMGSSSIGITLKIPSARVSRYLVQNGFNRSKGEAHKMKKGCMLWKSDKV